MDNTIMTDMMMKIICIMRVDLAVVLVSFGLG
jgi:hypothetical protein